MRSFVLSFVACAILLGCQALLTQTRFFEFDLVHDGQPTTPGAPIALSAGSIVELSVDLSEVDRYEEHDDEIESVDRAGLEADLSVAGATRFSLYLSDRSGLADPAAQATPLLRDFRIAAADSELDFDAVEAELESLDALDEAIRAGAFWLYLVGAGPGTVTFDSLELVVEFTTGL